MVKTLKIASDVNGNSRYVIHFLEFLTKEELNSRILGTAGAKYQLALTRAKLIGGKEYRAKSYGGGFVFKQYESVLVKHVEGCLKDLEDTEDYITAHDQVYLTVVNDYEFYKEIKQAVNDYYSRTKSGDECFKHIKSVVEKAAVKVKDQLDIKINSTVVFLAAVLVTLAVENEDDSVL